MTLSVPEPIKIVMRMIEKAAETGNPCPTNGVLAAGAGLSSAHKASEAVSFLETAGMIEVRRSRRARIATIVRTGKATAGTIAKPIKYIRSGGINTSFWTDARDDTLMEAMAQGLDFEHAANWLGCSPEICAVRFDELAARLGEQAA